MTALTITHQKVLTIADDAIASAAGEVVPSDWNHNHTMVGPANTQLGFDGSGNLTTTPYGQGQYTSQSATYAILTTDEVIECTANTFTVTLPTAVSVASKRYTIKNTGAGTVTVATTSAQTIDGATTASIAQHYQSITVVSNGVNWLLI